MTRQHLESITDAELAEMSPPANPELARVVEARACLENAGIAVRELCYLDRTNSGAFYALHALLLSVETDLARFEAYYRGKAVPA